MRSNRDAQCEATCRFQARVPGFGLRCGVDVLATVVPPPRVYRRHGAVFAAFAVTRRGRPLS
jgi:hypothetical protein